jgi:GGDEF domain-containing protein
VGLINRFRFFDVFSRLYSHELHGRKPCRKLMDTAPLVVEKSIGIQDLSRLVVASDRRYLWEGFIITDNGRYAGIGTGHDLMHQITELQINAARYANPLTLLPGNVPINEHMSRLLRAGAGFAVCYCDLDHFKAFNDRYGYRKGDDVIQTLGRILVEACDRERDFVGHIGGDDFIALFQSQDWEARCEGVVRDFGAAIRAWFSDEDLAAGGYFVEDRRGERVFHPLVSVSIGCVEIVPGAFHSHHEIAAVATEAKHQAKRVPGGCVFVNRRRYGD